MPKVVEIPVGKRAPLYRFFEVLPGLLSYGMLLLLFVLSAINKSTPVSPKKLIFWKSAALPTGVKSNLKSPDSIIRPFGVFTTIPMDSGIEWFVLK